MAESLKDKIKRFNAQQKERDEKATKSIKEATAANKRKRKEFNEKNAAKSKGHQKARDIQENLEKTGHIGLPETKNEAEKVAQAEKYMTQMEKYNQHNIDPLTGKMKDRSADFWNDLFKGKEAYHVNYPTLTEGQESALDQRYKQVAEGLPDLLKYLNGPEKSETAKQLEQMFSHMNNPILQSMMGGGPNEYKANVPFPTQLGRSGYGGGGYGGGAIEDLLSQLIGSGINSVAEYGSNNLPSWQQVQQSRPGQWLGNALSGLSNRFRGQ